MSPLKQVIIVAAILCLLPLATKILSKLHLIPLALFLLASQLFFPEWAAENRLICVLIFIASIVYFFARWIIREIVTRRTHRQLIEHVLETATPLYELADLK